MNGPADHVRFRQSGFTLIEMLVTLAILSTGLILVIEGMARSQHGIRVSENIMESSLVLEETMIDSELQLLQYDRLPRNTSSGRITGGGKDFKWKKQTQAYVHSSIQDETKLNLVSAEVSWKEGGKDAQMAGSMILLNRDKEPAS